MTRSASELGQDLTEHGLHLPLCRLDHLNLVFHFGQPSINGKIIDPGDQPSSHIRTRKGIHTRGQSDPWVVALMLSRKCTRYWKHGIERRADCRRLHSASSGRQSLVRGRRGAPMGIPGACKRYKPD